MMMEALKYCSWSINPELLTAAYHDISLQLTPSKTCYACFEALWQLQAGAKVQEGIGGTSLYDHRWAVEFAGRREKDPSALRRLARPMDRKSAEELFKAGRNLKAMVVPAAPSIGYHINLVRWQVALALRWGLRRMFYHVPRAEYHKFIERVELLANVSISEAHAKLDAFADSVEAMVLGAFEEVGIELKLLQPMEQGAEDPIESFAYPYRYPEQFGIDLDRVMGVEDLVELTIELEASKTRPGDIGIALCVLQLPSPYIDVCTSEVYNISL